MVKKTSKLKNPELELNEAYQKIIKWFFAYPDREIGLNNLSEEVRSSKTTTKKVVLKLEKEGFLTREVIGKMWRISCNQAHLYNLTRKVPYHLRLVYESGVLEAIHEIVPNPRAVVLFGSYRKGDDNEKSDIDLAVEVLDNEDLRLVELGVIKKFGFRTNVVINLHIFSRNKIDLNLYSNIVNGIVLEGFLEEYP